MTLPDRHTPKSCAKLATKSATAAASNARDNNTPRRTRKGSSSRSSGRASPQANRKTTQVIEAQTASDAFHGLIHAEHLGLLPNRMMTINLQAGGVDDPVATIGKLMALMRGAVRRHGPIAYIWVRETGPVVGDHVHILFHLPLMPERWFARRLPGWLKRCGTARKEGVTFSRIIRGASTRLGQDMTPTMLHGENLLKVFDYVIKHCSHDVQRAFGITSRGPCDVIGKRVSISENLHRKARSQCPRCDTSPTPA